MGRHIGTVRVSSKGQIVIPAPLRRRLGIKTGQRLVVRAGRGEGVVLEPAERAADAVEEMRKRLKSAARALGRDLVRELHARRRSERERERRLRERRGH